MGAAARRLLQRASEGIPQVSDTLLIHKFEPGDRVKAASTMGWLKLDTIGLVTAVHEEGSNHPDALFRDEGETIIVAWPKTAYTSDPAGMNDAWNGTIMGIGAIDIEDFEQPSYELPMKRHELSFIDNLLK